MVKAYDTTWMYGVLWDMAAIGNGGRMFSRVYDFLQERNCNARHCNSLFRTLSQKNGVPQGSVESLSILAIN